MRSLLLIGICLAVPSFAYDTFYSPDGDKRLCPDGYVYAGEDTKSVTKDVWIEEADRSPAYSCYKIFNVKDTYFGASQTCQDVEGQLVSLEDNQEISRLQTTLMDKEEDDEDKDDEKHHDDDHNDDNQVDLDKTSFLTSAIFFYHESQWNWMGSNKSFDMTLLDDMNETESGSCLSIHFDELSGGYFETVPCSQKSNFICEMRVETVTYFAWFVANWFSLLLVFLVVVLLISLCVTTTMFRNRQIASGRVYRASQPVFEDKPPSYNRATGQATATRYLNKGREFLGRVKNDERA